MKKSIFIILLLTFVIPFLFSCDKGSNNNEYIEGTDAAKLLLAQERLNEDIVNGSGNLFTTGEEAFNRIVRETRNYNKRFAGRPNETYTEIDGDTYKWYNDIEYSNFNSFFDSYAVNIEHSAKSGSELIDYVKKNIRVIDVWVDYEYAKYLLKVEKTSEMIFTVDNDGFVDICKRSTDENGNDVYELMQISASATIRMKYIPGLLYEFGIMMNDGEGYSHYLYADNSKGYWNIISTGNPNTTIHPDGLVFENVNFEALMMKDEAFYQFGYSLDNQGWSNGEVNSITLISNDGKTDLVTIGAGFANLFNTGIRGLDHIEITASPEFVGDYDPNFNNIKYVYAQDNVDENGKPYMIYTTSGHKSATAVLENGKLLNEGDRLVNDKVTIGRIDVGYVAGCDAYGTIPLRIEADNINDTFNILVEFLDQTGLSFRRDLETVLNGADFALKDVKHFSEYFQFNGYNIDSLENGKKALALEKKKFDELKNAYEAVKDLKVISSKNQLEMDSNIYFADVEVLNAGTISNNNLNITVSDFKVNVSDTILFVDGEKYKVVFGLLKEDGSIIPLTANNELEGTFVKGSPFEVTQTVNFDIPQVDKGNYKLVGYVATSEEGIRTTKTFVITGDFSEVVSNTNGIKISLTTNSDNQLIVNSEYDFNIYLETTEQFTYETLFHYMRQSAYNHGMIDEAVIEIFDGSNWIVLEKTEEVISIGQYRMKYIVTLENIETHEGYIFVKIS